MERGVDEIKWNGFLRQRRSLLAASIALAIAHLAGITLDKINLLGTELKVGSPIALNIALWLFWGYWLWRFYTYSCDVDATDSTLRRYRSRFHNLVHASVGTLFQFDPNVVSQLREHGTTFTGAEFENVNMIGPSTEGYRFRVHKLTISHVDAIGNHGTMQLGNRDMVVAHEYLRPFQYQAVRHVIFHTPVVTDFWLPYFVAVVPVAIAVTQGVVFLIRRFW